MEKRILFVGLSTARSKHNVASQFIKWAEFPHTWSRPSTWFKTFSASHVFLAYPAHRLRPFYMVNEAAGSMIRWISGPHFEEHSTTTHLYRFEFDEPTYRAIKLYSLVTAGSPYALLENAGIGLVRIMKLVTGRTIRNPFGVGDKAQKCSELIVRNVIERMDLKLKDLAPMVLLRRGHKIPTDVDSVGVRDIYELLEHLADGGVIARVSLNRPIRVGELETIPKNEAKGAA